MVISWPRKIKAKNQLRSQFTHVTDVAPTILEAAGVTAPKTVDGIEQMPLHGTSFVHTFDDPQERRDQRAHGFDRWG